MRSSTEGLDLALLKRLFLAVGPADIEAILRATPTGSYARRIWFLYEWLTGKLLIFLPQIRAHTFWLLIPSCNGELTEKSQHGTA